jgi:hypothetical protein
VNVLVTNVDCTVTVCTPVGTLVHLPLMAMVLIRDAEPGELIRRAELDDVPIFRKMFAADAVEVALQLLIVNVNTPVDAHDGTVSDPIVTHVAVPDEELVSPDPANVMNTGAGTRLLHTGPVAFEQ